MFERLIRRRSQATRDIAGPAALQDGLMEEIDDQLWFLSHEHVPNTFRGQPAAKMKAGFPPPTPVEPPDDLPPTSTASTVIDVYVDPGTRPGVGLDDIESPIPEGEVGF